MDLDHVLIPDREQAVALKMLRDVIIDGILVQIITVDQKLCIIPEFKHIRSPSSFCNIFIAVLPPPHFLLPCFYIPSVAVFFIAMPSAAVLLYIFY
jgi:hypothetical protein